MSDINVKISRGGLQTINTEIKRTLKLNNQDKTINKNGTYTADAGHTGLGMVIVDVDANKKYGVTIDYFLGNVDENGVLQSPTDESNLDFSGVKELGDSALERAFEYKNINSVSFPDLETVGENSMYYAFYNSKKFSNIDLGFPKLTLIKENGMPYAFSGGDGIKNVVFNTLEKINSKDALNSAFSYQKNLLSISFPEVVMITSANAIYGIAAGCSNLEILSFPKLNRIVSTSNVNGCAESFISGTKISVFEFPELVTCLYFGLYRAFQGSNITELYFPKLEKIESYAASRMCSNCKTLTKVTFPVLTSVSESSFAGCFYNNTGLTSISFPSLTTVHKTSFYGRTGGFDYTNYYAFQGCTNLTEIHFRADMQEKISACSGYANKFGADNATIYFDL